MTIGPPIVFVPVGLMTIGAPIVIFPVGFLTIGVEFVILPTGFLTIGAPIVVAPVGLLTIGAPIVIVSVGFLTIGVSFVILTGNKSFLTPFSELVPMPDDLEITASYKQLIRLEERGIDVYLPGETEKEYKVKDLLGTITPEKTTEEEILQILRKIKTDTDTMESLLKKANDYLLIQPNIFGVGINMNKIIQKLFSKKRVAPATQKGP